MKKQIQKDQTDLVIESEQKVVDDEHHAHHGEIAHQCDAIDFHFYLSRSHGIASTAHCPLFMQEGFVLTSFERGGKCVNGLGLQVITEILAANLWEIVVLAFELQCPNAGCEWTTIYMRASGFVLYPPVFIVGPQNPTDKLVLVVRRCTEFAD